MSRVAIVTGGTRGIGEAISLALKANGFKVAANYAGNDEWNFFACRGFCGPVRERLDIFAPNFLPVAIAQDRFKNNTNADRQSRYFSNSLFLQSRE